MRRRRKQPQPIGAVLEQVLGDLGLRAVAAAHRVGQHWEEAVGPEIARICRPVAVRHGVLEVMVESSVWCQTLQLQRSEMLAELRRVLGDDAPEDLRFRVG